MFELFRWEDQGEGWLYLWLIKESIYAVDCGRRINPHAFCFVFYNTLLRNFQYRNCDNDKPK